MCSIINLNKHINTINLNYIFNKIKKDRILIKINVTNDDTDNIEKKYDFSEITIINMPFDFEDILKKIIENINITNTYIIILCKSTNEQLKTKIQNFFTNNNFKYKIMILHLTYVNNYIPNFENVIVKNLVLNDETLEDIKINKKLEDIKINKKYDTVTKQEYKKKTYITNNTYIRFISKSLLYMFFVNFFKLCGFGKLIQISGTCWINSVINTFFMSTSIQKILSEKWDEMEIDNQKYINEIKQSSFDTCPLNIINMIYMLIYQIIKKKEKILLDKNIFMDFSNELYKIKEFEKLGIIFKGYRQGGDSDIFVNHLIKNIFNENECRKIPDSYYDILSTNITISHKYKMLVYNNTNNKNIIKEFIAIYDNNINIKYNLVGATCTTQYYNKSDNSFIGGHAVACFVCNNKEYLYDSNGILIKINWKNGDFIPYDTIVRNTYPIMYCKNTKLKILYYAKE